MYLKFFRCVRVIRELSEAVTQAMASNQSLQNVTVTFGFGVTYSMLQCDGIAAIWGGTQSAVQLGVTDVDTQNDIGVDTVVDSLDV